MENKNESVPAGADHGGKLSHDANAGQPAQPAAQQQPAKSVAERLIEIYKDSQKRYSEEVLKKK